MIRLSIQARQALARLTLPVLIVASSALMLLGKADTLLAERARIALADGLAPIYGVLAAPLGGAHARSAERDHLRTMRDENARLRGENEKLRRWQTIALALDAENQRLKASLHWIPDPDASLRHRAGGRRCGRRVCQGGAALRRPEPRHPQGRDRAWTSAAWSGGSPRSARGPRACC